jgi:osomolarity two-component system response regulator SSK1
MSMSLSKLPAVSSESVPDGAEQRLTKSEVLPPKQTRRLSSSKADRSRTEDGTVDGTSASRQSHTQGQDDSAAASPHPPTPVHNDRAHPAVTLETPTPVRLPVDPVKLAQQKLDAATELVGADSDDQPTELRPTSARAQSKPNPPSLLRRQSLVTPSNARVIKTLLEADNPQAAAAIASGPPTSADYFAGATAFSAGMLHRKIWVKRPNASATLVQIREDDLVDNVRDMILKKYANSLGKTFDSPDVTLRIHPRDSATNAGDRILGPEEEMCRTLDAYYPGGQTVNEALLIEVPHRKTPKPSPGLPYQYLARVPHPEHVPPYESSAGYFPPMADVHPSPAAMTAVSQESRASVAHTQHLHSISVLQSGQLPHLPNLPSPGATSRSRHHGGRPRIARQQTASPTTLTGNAPTVVTGRPSQQRQRHDSTASDAKHSTSSGHPPIPTPPAPTDAMVRQSSNPPTPRVASPIDKKRKKSKAVEHPSLPAGLLDNSVPPINVLIVEDNIINLRVLGAFMQRLKVRWQRAMNGKEAVTKWRTGGFHLVLMDIQLPIMNGLEATKEIRRLERVNNIGVFSSGSHEAPNNRLSEANNHGRVEEDDKLGDRSLFKSPVIIVALTASSLQSDRHEALAAGCNDFLTKARSDVSFCVSLGTNICHSP